MGRQLNRYLADAIRRAAGTPSIFDGIRRLVSQGFGERSILPGILLDTVTSPGKKRTERDVESVIDTLSSKKLGDGGKLYPGLAEQYYRKVTDYSQTQRYWRPGDPASEITQDPNKRVVSPSSPFKPISGQPAQAASRPYTPLGPQSTKGSVTPFSNERGRQVESGRWSTPPPEGPGTPPGSGWTDPIEVSSSHIFSIAYNYNANLCAVTFRLPTEGLVVKGAVPSLCSGEYASWTQFDANPSITYVYGSPSKPFPLSLFEAFRKAPSKGRFLWENIRGCGEPLFPFTTFDITADGAIFLPSYDGGGTQGGGISNGPSNPPKRSPRG